MTGAGALHGHYMSALVWGLDIGNEWTNLNNMLTALLTGTNRNSCTTLMTVYVIGSIVCFADFYYLRLSSPTSMKPCNYVTPHSPHQRPNTPLRSALIAICYTYICVTPLFLPLLPSFFFSSIKNSILRQSTTYIHQTHAYFDGMALDMAEPHALEMSSDQGHVQ
jgi:hypothetical protein